MTWLKLCSACALHIVLFWFALCKPSMKQGFFHNDGLLKWDGIERLPNDKGPFVGRMGASASARPDEQPCAERFATSLCTNGLVQDLTLEEIDLTLEEADVKSELTLEESGAEPDAKDLTTDAPAASSTDMHAASTCLQHPSFDAGACDQALRTRLDDTVGSSATPPAWRTSACTQASVAAFGTSFCPTDI